MYSFKVHCKVCTLSVNLSASAERNLLLKFMLNELMLYKAFFDESELENIEDLYNEEYNGVRKVDIIKKSSNGTPSGS